MSDGKAHLAKWMKLDQAVQDLRDEGVPMADVLGVVRALYQLFAARGRHHA